jgi:hypothetical protein
VLQDLSHIWQIALSSTNDSVVNVLEVVELHPRFATVLSKFFRVERKQQKSVHFVRVLAHHELPEILGAQFFEPEEGHVREDLVKYRVVSVCRARVLLEKDADEGLS